jgi:Zinc carboxypeptidase
MLYRAPGNIVDWMYKRAGIKYSYVVHLRDTGTVGPHSFGFYIIYFPYSVRLRPAVEVDTACRRGDGENG